MENFSDQFVSAWKAISIVTTGLFGILGLLAEFRDKASNKITRAGKFSLAGIVISTVVGTTAQIYDTKSADKKAAEQQSSMKKLLNDTFTSVNQSELTLMEIRAIIPLTYRYNDL